MTSRVRTVALVGAWLSLAAHVAGLAHVVAVRHATCPTHGEVTHGTPGSLAPAVTAEENAGLSAPAAAAAEDDHCLALMTRRRELVGLVPIGPVALVAPAADALLLLAQADPAPPPVPLYRLAPKTPPPARASS